MNLSALLSVAGLTLLQPPAADRDPVVSWVHTTELSDPSMYLSGGELILTTGLWRRRRSDADQFAGVLAQVGVAALGYGLPGPGTSVPPDVRAACAAHGLGLVEVPYETPFIAISKAFVEALTEVRQSWLLSALRRSEAMTAAIGRGSGAESILRMLRRDTGLTAAAVTRTGEVLATTGSPFRRDELARLLGALRGASQLPFELREPPGPATVFAIHSTGRGDGYLVCWAADGISDEARTVVDQAVTFLGLELARRQAVRSTELRFSGELLDLIGAGPARVGELAARLETFGIDPQAPIATVAVSAEHDGGDEPEIRALDSVARELGLRSVLIVRGGDHLLVMDAAAATPEDVAEHAMQALAQDPSVRRGAAGVGSTAATLDQLLLSVSEAQQACALARHDDDDYAIVRAHQAGSHRLLLALASTDVRDALVGSLIDPLRTYDAQRQTQLVETLATFLGSAGQWQRTADALHVHVNTLRHRLARVEQLTGRDLASMADRVDFFLALRADGAVA
ncbi:MAG: PucR family transcriptional regulator ligand-binding domain-containing protein [Actinobacteria bacterium]|nr:PucR family transcriptional regulator ligand-binding domain-containing protein [Actinomycetota bacterium]